MKWLKIKRCLKIFSVIICSIFIFSNKASAIDYNFSYNGKNFSINQIRQTMKEKYSNYSNDIDNCMFELAFIKDNKIYVAITQYSYIVKKTTASGKYRTGTEYVRNNSYVRILPTDTKGGFIASEYYDGGTKYVPYYVYTYDLSTEEEKYERLNGNTKTYFPKKLDNETIEIWLNRTVLYSNTNFNPQYGTTGERKYIRPFDEEFIVIEKPLKYRMQFNNDVSPDLKQITFDFSSYEFTEGSNPVKSKIEIGSWNEDASLSNYLSQTITGYGTDNIETDLTSYFNISIDTTNYLTTKELTFTYTLKKDLPSDILRLKVYYDFETFDNNYYFNVFDNTSWGSPIWAYVEDFLVGYKKYTFPDGYDLAIIRSKNFNDLESFYISDKIYFTSDEYYFNLKLYDFTNNIEKYNYNSLTQYLINPVYLKIPIKIDETNNIFPVLTKPINNESGVFYLKDDLFVQFVNSKNLDSIVENIPKNDFDNNNDLIISDDIKDLIPAEEKEESLTIFFNQFWKMFEKFSDILSYITACFSEFYLSLPTTIQFFLCLSFAFVIYKMLVFFIL